MRPIPTDDDLRSMTKKQLRRYVRSLESAVGLLQGQNDRTADQAASQAGRLRLLSARNLNLRDAVHNAHRASNEVSRVLEGVLTVDDPGVILVEAGVEGGQDERP